MSDIFSHAATKFSFPSLSLTQTMRLRLHCRFPLYHYSFSFPLLLVLSLFIYLFPSLSILSSTIYTPFLILCTSLPLPQLLDMGIVYKENFDEEEDSKFHMDMYSTEKRENAAMREKKEREDKARESSAKAFDDWVQLKGIRDQALRCLGLLEPPVLSVGARELGLGSAGGPRSAWTSTSRGQGQGPRDEGLQLVIDVRLSVGVVLLIRCLINTTTVSSVVLYMFFLCFVCLSVCLSVCLFLSHPLSVSISLTLSRYLSSLSACEGRVLYSRLASIHLFSTYL